MSKRTNLKARLVMMALLLALATEATFADPIVVGGTISTNTVWQGEVLVEESVFVEDGVTLTVLPGTHVRFKHYRGYREPEKRLRLEVYGRLIAEGTAAQPIYFTSDAPDPQNGDWSMINLHHSTDSVFSYCVIEFAQQGLNNSGGSHEISHCVIRWNNWEGLFFQSYSEPNITYCHIVENGYPGLAAEQFCNITMDYCESERNGNGGVHIIASTAEIRRSLVHDNLAHGLSAFSNSTLRALGVASNDNGWGMGGCGIGFGPGTNIVEVNNVTLSGNRSGNICGSYTVVEANYEIPESIDIGFAPDMSYELGYIPGDPDLDGYMYVYPDDETRRTVRKIGNGMGLTWSLAWDGQYIWTATLLGTVSKLNPQTGAVLQQFTAPGPQPWGMTYDGEHLWIVDFAEKRISKVDPATGAELATYPTPDPVGGCIGVTWDGSYLYVMGFPSSVIYKMNRQGNLVGIISLDTSAMGGIAWDGQHFWVPGEGKILKFDTQGHMVGWIYAASEDTWDLTWDGQYLWASQSTNQNWRDAKIYALKILNAHDHHEGVIISLDRYVYSCSGTVGITLLDLDLKGSGTEQVVVETDGGDWETVVLAEKTPAMGIFTGTISTDSGSVNIEDGVLQLADGEIITATYNDANDGTGNPGVAIDTAMADCEWPVIFNVQIDAGGPEPTVSFETDETTTAGVLCGTACGADYTIEAKDLRWATSHTIKLTGVSAATDYFFIVEATDAVGNESVDDNAGNCYTFTTDAGPRDIYVPGDYATIQAAIDQSWDGGRVLVADGTYTGEGNRVIDFRGAAITVKSENGPENCIINCEGSGRGFNFQSGEDTNSVLDGFTVTNSNSRGIICRDSSPTIKNFIITNNSTTDDGGGIYCQNSSPTLANCIFKQNLADDGAGICCLDHSSPTIVNCIFTENTANICGGAIFSDTYSIPTVTNCTISQNSAYAGGAIYSRGRFFKITNSILWGNSTDFSSGIYGRVTANYSDIQGGWPGTGNINADPCFVEPSVRDYHLLPDSPCINAGDPCHPYDPNETDLDGKRRIIASRIDMGAYEFGNIPVAVAGPNQTAYAWLDSIAEVTLDGSASYDDDGDPLTYLWTWEIGSELYQANGVSPTTELTIGEHIIELIVNDGIDDSEPNYTTVTVIEPLQCPLWILPRTINHKSRQRHIMAWLSLPAGISKDDIDENIPLTLYPGDIEASRQFIFENKRRDRTNTSIVAFFKKKDLMTAVSEDGPVHLEVVGRLKTSRYFFGQRTVRIINPPHRHPRRPTATQRRYF